jgi:hypothetical protein
MLHWIWSRLLLYVCLGLLSFTPQSDGFVTPTKPGFSKLPIVSSTAPQILEFQEPQTNVTVVLVGAMHYNPSSINLAKTTIESLANQQKLGSVIVESCDIRWNKTLDLYKEYPLLKGLLKNEMLTSSELAQEFGLPVILGDQRINITSDALKGNLKETFADLTSPPSGWKRFAYDVQQAWSETVPFGGEGYLSSLAFLDPRLLLVLPVSLIKYPLSFLVRDPLPTSIFLLGVCALNCVDTSNTVTLDAIMDDQIPLYDWLISFGLAALETIIFAKLLLKPLLAERNIILAQSILGQCRMMNGPGIADSGWFTLFSKASSSASEIVYAPGSKTQIIGDGEDKVVVAILGMAHCNGIKKLLKEQRI